MSYKEYSKDARRKLGQFKVDSFIYNKRDFKLISY